MYKILFFCLSFSAISPEYLLHSVSDKHKNNDQSRRIIKFEISKKGCRLEPEIKESYDLICSLFRPATPTDFISIHRFFTLRIWQNTDFLP